MINVHIPANSFYPELPGGPNQYFRYGPYLRDRGVQLHVHTALRPHHEEEELEIRSIKIRRYQLAPDLTLREEMNELCEHLVSAIGDDTKGTVLHPLGAALDSVGAVAALWKARLRGIAPCFHCMMVPIRDPLPFPRNLREATRRRVIFSAYRKVLMCSHIMGRAFNKLAGISQKRIEVIPNGIDLSVFSPVSPERKRELRAELELPQDDPIVLYVGSVLARKGVEVLIDAWESVLNRQPRARLVIVGSTGQRPTIRDTKGKSEVDRYVESVFDQIEGLSNPGSVIFAGEVENVQEYYRTADLFAFASRREGLPSVVLEAMGCGLPCVVAPFIGLPDDGEEYGVAGEHYVKTSHDPQQMADDLIRMIENDDARMAMSEKGCEWIRETQEMGKAADRLAEVYHSMVTSTGHE